jgi:hypothetical protein
MTFPSFFNVFHGVLQMNSFRYLLSRATLALTLALMLAACDAADSRDPPATAQRVAAAEPARKDIDRAALVDEIASTLQACSYDGEPVRVAAVGQDLPSDCRDMVAQIMKFTGLPQNFTVVEAPVPNAAAIILLDDQKVPQRVIAFNKDFLDIVRSATGGNGWAPISIMAHEIGHHLSGHTITPGGSQPPTELEADKFSGFVLYKMGASLDDAQTAMSRLVKDGPDGGTHPGRGKRLGAIRDGWQLACEQQGGACSGARSAAQTAQTAPMSPLPATSASPTAVPAPRLPAPPSAAAPLVAVAATRGADALPVPGSTPSKFDRFIYDEYGVLDATWRATFEQQMFDHAKAHGVEIVTLLVKDLHGLDAQQYAHAMMRQLRVGKLDVGNGAVLVVAPDARQTGIAMGPGVALQMDGHDKKESLDRWLESAWSNCQRKHDCGNWTENFMLAADHIRRDTDDIEWTIRYASLGALMTAYAEHNEARENGAAFDPKADPGYQKIAQLEGEIVALDVKPGYADAHVSQIAVERAKAVHVRTPDDYIVMLYVDPQTEALMPGGKLQAGRSYRFTARVDSLSWNRKDTQSFDLLSYDESGR